MNHSDTDRTVPPRSHDEAYERTLRAVQDGSQRASEKSDSTQSFLSGSTAHSVQFGTGQFGRYQIQKLIGEGGMGAVYLAQDTLLDRQVALKIPNLGGNREMAAARFLREAQAAAGIQHPNICPIYDVGQIDSTSFMCMAFIAGETLGRKIGPGRPMEPKEAARIVRAVAIAMQVAHSHGVIHRDLKPANIMMDVAGQPIIMDFGLARRQTASAPTAQLTVQGEVMGTPAYMPPEQVAGDVDRMGPASDIYSLGVVFYELLTGTTPFGGDMFALLSQIALDPPPAPSIRRPGLDAKIDLICLKALAKKPEDRWKSMQVFAEMLGGIAGVKAAAGPVASQFDGPHLTLKVEGTNLAYRPPPGLPVISIGRQKRRSGEPVDSGNDFVLRVAGNEALSSRISRRHFEIHRTNDGFNLVDKSKTGVTRNGQPLPKEIPIPLNDGDRLGVAGVITLELIVGSYANPQLRQTAIAEVPAPSGAGGGQVQIEASVGDMVTID